MNFPPGTGVFLIAWVKLCVDRAGTAKSLSAQKWRCMQGSLAAKPVLLFGLLLKFLSPAFGQSPLAGDWLGTLNAGGNTMRVAWHVTAGADGSVTSTVDNLDQSILGIKVKNLQLKGSDITFSVDDMLDVNGQQLNIAGTFTGKLSADQAEVTGSWTQTAPQEEGPDPLEMKRQAGTAGPPATAGAAAQPAAAPNVAGDWDGALDTPAGQLRLVLHLTAGAGGSLTATLDSVDQGAMGIPVSSASLKAGKLTLTVDAVNGSYEGTVNAGASAIEGTWTQGASLALNFKRAVAKAAATPAPPSPIDGSWTGILDAGAAQLHIVVKIANTSEGLTAQLQSPDQGQNWIPATAADKNGDAVKLAFAGLGAEFAGKVSADLQTMEGTFTQMGNAMPLKLTRGSGKE